MFVTTEYWKGRNLMLKWRELETDERENWYHAHICRDFPADEVKPFETLESLIQKGKYHCYLFFDESGAAAYAYTMTEGRFTLLDYLAVEPERRGKGIGSAVLTILTGTLVPNGNTMLIEAENPACAQDLSDRTIRLSRVRFYKGAGMKMTEVLENTFGVEYRILTGAAACSDPEAMQGLEAVYRAMLPEAVFNQNFSVRLP